MAESVLGKDPWCTAAFKEEQTKKLNADGYLIKNFATAGNTICRVNKKK